MIVHGRFKSIIHKNNQTKSHDQTGDIKQIQAYDVEYRNIRIEGNVARLFNFIVREGTAGYVSKFSFVDWTVEKLSDKNS